MNSKPYYVYMINFVLLLTFDQRNPSVKFSDVYPREDDDDKTWRGDDSWRVNTDGNHYSEPPGNVSAQLPMNDEETNIAIPQNEKSLEKMGELHSVKYSGARRVL